MELQPYIEKRVRRIRAELDRRLPAESEWPSALHRAMRYSVFAGGKRLRPILCLAAAESVGGAHEAALPAALALEVLHTYTLIHDDLPGMDNDALRRGRPTLHVVAGEATAILAGDALLTLAFEWLAGVTPPGLSARLALELAHAAGSRGVVGGQVEDLAAEGQRPDAERVDAIHRHKTAALLRAAVRMGGLAGGASEPHLAALTAYGEAAGLAFQIVDDILNETSDAATLGKAAGSDRARGKMTYVAVHGLEAARARARALVEEAVAALGPLPGPREPLAALARHVAARRA